MGTQRPYYPRPGRRVRRDAPLTRTLGIRLAEDEAAIIDAAVAASGMNRAQWLRMVMLDAINFHAEEST